MVKKCDKAIIKVIDIQETVSFWWMCRWAQDASVISASSVARSPGRKIKASA